MNTNENLIDSCSFVFIRGPILLCVCASAVKNTTLSF
jgi:hypothetical protein